MKTTLTYVQARNQAGQFTSTTPHKVLSFPFRAIAWVIKHIVNLTYRLLAYVLPSRRISVKLVMYQIAVLGWVLAAFFAHQHYVIRCGYNHTVHGWFQTQEDCDYQAKLWAADIEDDRRARLVVESDKSANCIGNEDICQ